MNPEENSAPAAADLVASGGRSFMLKGVSRIDDARRAVDAGVDALSVSNHGGNNLDGTPAAIRMVRPISDAVGTQVEVVMDGGIRRGSDVVSGPAPQGCRFVAVASVAGTQGLFHLTAYTSVKHAVVGIVKGLAADLVGTGVAASAVSPGSTDTDMLRATADLYEVSPGELVAHQAIRRVIDPAEIAAAIAFCASPAGGVVNGSVLHADGGFGG